MNAELIDGADSGPVPEKVKLQLLTDSMVKCAAPGCEKRLVQHQTKLGECAHIIPRRVGSHPREDYKTSLADRKKPENLLYLCEHHKIIDNPIHAGLYTADVLRKWKRDHEAWAKTVTKNSQHIPQKFQQMLSEFQNNVSEQLNASRIIFDQLLDACENLLDRQLLTEAKSLATQIDILLLTVEDSELHVEADILNASILIQSEKIPEAKEKLLEIILEHPSNIDAMLRYVELCEQATEPHDDLDRIEKLVRDLDCNNPRLILESL
jgi:hypothetical protein